MHLAEPESGLHAIDGTIGPMKHSFFVSVMIFYTGNCKAIKFVTNQNHPHIVVHCAGGESNRRPRCLFVFYYDEFPSADDKRRCTAQQGGQGAGYKYHKYPISRTRSRDVKSHWNSVVLSC